MPVSTLRRVAPAKLNLFLHVTGQRADGYHQLQTVFQLLDFGDELEFRTREDRQLRLQLDPASPVTHVPLQHNLILDAAEALRQRFDHPGIGADIVLKKRIPMGAGLGGGSSDAATSLLALNELWGLHAELPELMKIGLTLGADVPVFLQGHSAWAEGIGEQLEPLTLPPSWYVVITPDCEVSTARIFTHENLTRNSATIKIADFLAGGSRNDCESVTCELYPRVAEALNWLRQFAESRMTGTGSSVFASFPDAAGAEAVLARLPKDWTGFVAPGVNSLEELSGAT
jgi:4-diphosphocytidyl-2-C-methyl-D-erythritol kinase